VWLLALFPGSLFFSAAYSESLFLALSVGALYAAREERWAWAGALGGLAALTRNTGVILLVPLAMMWLGRPRWGREGAWLGLVPLGLGAYLAWCGVAHGDVLAPLHAQRHWGHEFHGPLSGAWLGVRGVFADGLGRGFEPPLVVVGELAALLFAAAGGLGALRRLPPAYGVYALLAVAVPLSSPWPEHPLMSLPRYVAVLFPLHMWLATWTRTRARYAVALGVSAVGLGLGAAQFATWGWFA
jgi:hypothetical protein